MLFTNIDRRYYLSHNLFSENMYSAYGIIEAVKIGNTLLPYDQCAIDRRRQSALLKMHNEFLERFRIGINSEINQNVAYLNLIDNSIGQVSRAVLGYGLNDMLGIVDTTGSASGIPSEQLVAKARNELIEKNEVLLLWYKQLGCYCPADEKMQILIRELKFYHKQLFVFSCNNLSTTRTYVVLLFDSKNRLISTGVCAHSCGNYALRGALLEAKLLEYVNMDSRYYRYRFLSNDEHCKIYDYVVHLSKMLGTEEQDDSGRNWLLSTKPWIKSLNLAVLNTHNYQKEMTVRCFSPDLLNCIPLKENILLSSGRTIISHYDVMGTIANVPDCLIV